MLTLEDVDSHVVFKIQIRLSKPKTAISLCRINRALIADARTTDVYINYKKFKFIFVGTFL